MFVSLTQAVHKFPTLTDYCHAPTAHVQLVAWLAINFNIIHSNAWQVINALKYESTAELRG